MDDIGVDPKLCTSDQLEVRRMNSSAARYFFISVIFVIAGCTDTLLGPVPPTTPTAIFDEVWKDFDARYALFDVRGVNWDSLYQVYRPRITDRTPDSVLAKTIDTVLRTLHDPHVGFGAYSHGEFFNTYSGDPTLDSAVGFDFSTVSSFYLRGTAEETGFGEIMYGFIQDSIGYIYLPTFDQGSDNYGWTQYFDGVLDSLRTAKGLILDIRDNSGGTQGNFYSIASHFFTATRTLILNSLRNGPKHSDFSAAEAITIVPAAKVYTKPIVLITNRFTLSAAEWFTLAMKELPNVIRVGDTTSGGFSGRLDRELANGWTYSLSIEKVTDAKGISYEGRGIPPDITIHLPTHYQAAFSKDTTLDKAIEILRK